jgi:DNA-binding NarL/FixJ family response regulator
VGKPQIRVMLVDTHRLVLSGLQRLINDEKPAMAVVATAVSLESAVQAAHDAKPNVIVIDSALAAGNRAALAPVLANGSNSRLLVLSGANGDAHEAIVQGACGVVHKDDSPELLIKAIRKVHEGELWLDRSTTGRLFVELSRQRRGLAALDPNKRRADSLTTREHEVVCTFVSRPGVDNKTLASSLKMGEHTLRNHLSRIYDKLGVPNRVELYVFAQRYGLHE